MYEKSILCVENVGFFITDLPILPLEANSKKRMCCHIQYFVTILLTLFYCSHEKDSYQ